MASSNPQHETGRSACAECFFRTQNAAHCGCISATSHEQITRSSELDNLCVCHKSGPCVSTRVLSALVVGRDNLVPNVRRETHRKHVISASLPAAASPLVSIFHGPLNRFCHSVCWSICSSWYYDGRHVALTPQSGRNFSPTDDRSCVHERSSQRRYTCRSCILHLVRTDSSYFENTRCSYSFASS